MKSLRLILLVLLCILLPVRGAMAATMLCPDGAPAGSATAAAGSVDHVGHAGHAHHAEGGDHTHHGTAVDHSLHGDRAAAHHAADADGATPDTASGDHPTTCHLCASGCCMASIVGAVPSLGEAGPISRVSFPALTARVPAFQSDGQERPPRTI